MKNERITSFDCLRVFACFLVILLHVSAYFVIKNIEQYNFQFTIGNFYDSFSRGCVPLFIMLSGGLILNNYENKNFQRFYTKSFKKIFIPTIIWSVIYVVYSYILEIGDYILNKNTVDYLTPIKNWILGKPFYHMWYLYMLIGLYAVAPLLILLKKEIKQKTFLKLSIALLILGAIISSYDLPWIIQFIKYIGYFMLGSSLKEYFFNRKNNIKRYLLISLTSFFMVFFITEIFVKYNLYNKTLYFYSYLSPFVILGSISVYIIFLNIDINLDIFNRLAPHTFNIYLIHAGILSAIQIVFFKILKIDINPFWYILIMSLFIFYISYILSSIINKIIFKLKNNRNNNFVKTTI